jgi:dihydroorotase
MADILLKNIKIQDTNSPFHGQRKNIWIREARIHSISDEIPTISDTQIIDCQNFSVSVGWFDMRCSIPEPGYEHKETFLTASRAATKGGFTDLAVLPNTQPPLQSKEAIHYVRSRSLELPQNLHLIAAASKDLAGTDMSEMLDLQQAGAIAFSDGLKSISSVGLKINLLQYLQFCNCLLMDLPEEKTLSKHGVMHEGISSTRLGMKGIPSMSEKMAIRRDLDLLEYTGGKIHFSTISTAESVELIREAKAKGLKISCDVAAHQLAFTDEDLADFDTYLKVNPPFRTEKDIEALRAGLLDGTIDAIVSAHCPQDTESKQLEFDLAEFGIIGLETAFAVARTFSGLPIDTLIQKITSEPRKILNLPIPSVSEGETACLTVFDPDRVWTFSVSDIASLSRNTPFVGKQLKGKALGIVNKGAWYAA